MRTRQRLITTLVPVESLRVQSVSIFTDCRRWDVLILAREIPKKRGSINLTSKSLRSPSILRLWSGAGLSNHEQLTLESEIERQRISLNRAPPRDEFEMAWRQAWPARLKDVLAQHRAHSRNARRRSNPSPDRERLLGSSRFRAAADRSRTRLMAALDQHRSRFALGYRSLGSCSTSSFIRRTGGTEVGDRFVC